MTGRFRTFLVVAVLSCAGQAAGQDVSPQAATQSTGPADVEGIAPPAEPQPAPLPATAASAPKCSKCIPALTPISLVIDADLGSKISTTGQTFSLHLAEPLVIDGQEILAAGTTGQGEVVHAKKAGGGGAPGELVLAARFLTVGERTVRLRSMRVALAGKDKMGTVNTINAVAAGTVPVVGFIGFAINGHDVVYPKGTIAAAKIAQDFSFESSGNSPIVAVSEENLLTGDATTEAPATLREGK